MAMPTLGEAPWDFTFPLRDRFQRAASLDVTYPGSPELDRED